MGRVKQHHTKDQIEEEDEDAPEVAPAESGDESAGSGSEGGNDSTEEEYDSAADDDNDNDNDSGHDDGDDLSDASDPQVSDGYYDSAEDEFEEQGSSDDEEDRSNGAEEIDSDDDEEVDVVAAPDGLRAWPRAAVAPKRGSDGKRKEDGTATGARLGRKREDGAATGARETPVNAQTWMHTDDLSSDDEDEDGKGNRIGRVPLHWYDDQDHIGYDAHGEPVVKAAGSAQKDALDRALAAANGRGGERFTVHDALNARDVTLTTRQVELLRRVQGGAYAHPEHDGNPDYVPYFSGTDPEKSGLSANRYEKKSRFQPSKWEKLQVRRLLHRLKCGSINMDYLEGRVRDMNDLVQREDGAGSDRPFALWRGDEEDELALRKGPQHMPAPKVPPPGHALSYNPPAEYLPSPAELEEWEGMDPEDRPHGHCVPKKLPNLRSVGAYEHAVRERFERCLDLYLCPRASKRRLNIDPESLVPRLPRASDLRPFPTAKCVRYNVPGQDAAAPPMVRCLSASPDGQYLASGGEDGVARLWEVESGRLLRSWDLKEVVAGAEARAADEEEKDESKSKKQSFPIVSLDWNPNRSHHVLLAAIGKCAIIISTGTGGSDDSEVTEALLSVAAGCKGGGNIAPGSRAAKVVAWSSLPGQNSGAAATPVSAYGGASGPVALLRTHRADVAHVKWHRKGDYFTTVSPGSKAAAVLIHQLSRAASQQPFGKSKGGEAQLACFHPHQPFLFVATKEHVRVYHLVKQVLVKRLLTGCRHVSSLDVHAGGDHIIVGSLDRRLVWFDLDLASTPYKTLKYHERALRSVGFHPRYPLMASASDDGSVHVFHGMVYSDLMRNPLIVPVKVLRGHAVLEKTGLGVLCMMWHPTQPWLFSAGADGNIHLFQDL